MTPEEAQPKHVLHFAFNTLRPSVQSFAQDMERVLRKNDHKPGWEDMDYLELLQRILEEVLELQEAIRSRDSPGRIRDEAIDVGNFAMFIASRAYHDERGAHR